MPDSFRASQFNDFRRRLQGAIPPPPQKIHCLVNAGPTSSSYELHLWRLIETTVFRLCWSSYCEQVCILDSLSFKAEGQQNLYPFGFPILIGPIP